MSVICPYCHREAKLEDSSVVYGRSYGMIWRCAPCDAYVGCHKNKGGRKPLGRLANAELRQLKIKCHGEFDPIWKSNGMSRSQAYKWLAKELEIDIEECHIGMFDVERCKSAIRKIQEHQDQAEAWHDRRET